MDYVSIPTEKYSAPRTASTENPTSRLPTIQINSTYKTLGSAVIKLMESHYSDTL